ncbi:MAG: class II glutamine amidotransferase [Melioribacteraceae bacterium]|nr:class II glutamine amidotransferase [Melioribacteraceae bacterium]
MCELLGLNFNKPVKCSISFRGFRHRGKHNPHGWGIARFDGPACQVFKEPINASNSKLATFLKDYDKFVSKIFIGHVRYASKGEPALKNTHPFIKTFRSRELALAHNGTLDPVIKKTKLKFHPVGETDSEYLLCALLTIMSDSKISFTDFKKIEVILRDFNECGNMNILFSEGENLFVYRDVNGYNGLCMTERCAPYSKISLRDEDWEVDLAENKSIDQRGFIIATRPLTNEKWNELTPGCLYVFKDGQLLYGE